MSTIGTYDKERRALGVIPLHVLVTEEPEGHFAAHCLELDLVAEAPTQDQALEDIEGVIRAAIEYAIDNDNLDHLFKPAPAECWNPLSRAVPLGERQIRIEESAPRAFWRPLQYTGFLYSAPGAVSYA